MKLHNIQKCIKCGNEAAGYFSTRESGFVCYECSKPKDSPHSNKWLQMWAKKVLKKKGRWYDNWHASPKDGA